MRRCRPRQTAYTRALVVDHCTKSPTAQYTKFLFDKLTGTKFIGWHNVNICTLPCELPSPKRQICIEGT